MGRRLPWQGIRKATKVQRNEAICDIKESISPNDICKDLPRIVGQRNFLHSISNDRLNIVQCGGPINCAFSSFMEYAKNLEYDETPDYSLCRGFFRDRMNDKGWNNDRVFDWNEVVRDNDSVKTIRLSAETLSLT